MKKAMRQFLAVSMVGVMAVAAPLTVSASEMETETEMNLELDFAELVAELDALSPEEQEAAAEELVTLVSENPEILTGLVMSALDYFEVEMTEEDEAELTAILDSLSPEDLGAIVDEIFAAEAETEDPEMEALESELESAFAELSEAIDELNIEELLSLFA